MTSTRRLDRLTVGMRRPRRKRKGCYNQFHFVTYNHCIHHHQKCFGECQAHGLKASKEGLGHISSVHYDRPNQGTNGNDETKDRYKRSTVFGIKMLHVSSHFLVQPYQHQGHPTVPTDAEPKPPAHPHGSTTCAIRQSRFVTTCLPSRIPQSSINITQKAGRIKIFLLYSPGSLKRREMYIMLWTDLCSLSQTCQTSFRCELS